MDKRRQLAKSLDGVVRELRGPLRLPGASPLNRVALRPYERELATLAARLGDTDRPVTARGLRLVNELVTNGGSPLYDRARVGVLPATIDRILGALEPQPH
jgi:hypothetical protein